MKYNISIDPSDIYNTSWRSLTYLNGDINIILLPKDYYYDECELVKIEVFAYSADFIEHNQYELNDWFLKYCFGDAISSAVHDSSGVIVRRTARGNIDDYMSYLAVKPDDVHLLPNDIQMAILMNLDSII